MILLALVLLGLLGSWLHIPEATVVTRSSLLGLVFLLARNPRSPGLLAAMLAILKKGQ